MNRLRSSGEAWELAFQKDGHVFPESFERFGELVDAFRGHGCHDLLDLGCGTGRHVVGLATQGFRVCGLDYSPTGLRLTREWVGKQSAVVSLVLGDARRPLPFRDSAFDGLLSTQVIHHGLLSSVQETIAELWRVLRTGGLLFVTVPARLDDDVRFDEIEPGTYVPASGIEAGVPHHLFTPQQLQAELAGFRALDLSIRGAVVLAFLGVKETDNESGTRGRHETCHNVNGGLLQDGISAQAPTGANDDESR